MEYLHQFLPTEGQEIYPIVAFGDGLSVERMLDSKKAQVTGETPKDRLEGLVPSPLEFHRRDILFQDPMNLFCKRSRQHNEGVFIS